MIKCLKCQKEYNPKRSDKLFCGTSCGNAYRQQQKRDALKKARLVGQGFAVAEPLTKLEIGLWTVLVEVAMDGVKLHDLLKLPLGDVKREGLEARLMKFVADCKTMIDEPRVIETHKRMKEEDEVKARIKDKHEKQTAKKAANNKYKQSDGQQTEKPDNA